MQWETFTYIHTHTYASEYHNKQRDGVAGGGQRWAGWVGFNLVVVGVGLVVVVAERFALFIVVADRSQNIIEICQTARF